MTHAGRVADAAGLKVSPAIMRRVSATLLGAAVDRHEREKLRRGRLTSEHQAPGFEAFTGRVSSAPLRLVRPSERREAITPAPPSPSRPSGDDVRRLRNEARALRTEARERERRAAVLERETERTRDAALKTAESADELRRRLKELEERTDDRHRAAERAKQEALRAREEANEAARRAKEAEDRVTTSAQLAASAGRSRRQR